jgi:hypothetical protein
MWQPIETAPKTQARNRAVLVYVPGCEEDDERVMVARFWGRWSTVEDGADIEPTHWMPLPDPPDDASEEKFKAVFQQYVRAAASQGPLVNYGARYLKRPKDFPV